MGEDGLDDEEDEPVDEEELVDFIVPSEKVDAWYGALNQGRLALDARYELHKVLSGEESIDEQSDAWHSAFGHYQVYSRLQAPLLHLMEMNLGLDDEDDELEELTDEEIDRLIDEAPDDL